MTKNVVPLMEIRETRKLVSVLRYLLDTVRHKTLSDPQQL